MDRKLAFVRYCDAHYHNEHKECSLQQLMVQLGHPYAAEYLRARKEFDRLKYTATEHSRFYSYVDDWNFTRVTAPRLLLPGDHPPGPENIQALAAAGWHDTGDTLEYGYFHIRTTDEKLHQVLEKIMPTGDARQIMTVYDRHVMVMHPSAFNLLRHLLDRHQGGLLHLLRIPEQPAPAATVPFRDTAITDAIGTAPDAWL